MTSIDQKILEALEAEFPQGAEDLRDTNLFDDVFATFRGQRRWLNFAVIFGSLIYLGVTVWATIEFLHASDVLIKLNWLALAGASFAVISLMKLWYWQEMQTNRLRREMKRIELMLASRGEG